MTRLAGTSDEDRPAVVSAIFTRQGKPAAQVKPYRRAISGETNDRHGQDPLRWGTFP